MKFFKLEAEYDTVYIKAESLEEAQDHVTYMFGDIPEELMTWTEIEESDLPDDQIWIEFESEGPGELSFGDDDDVVIFDLDE